MSIETLRKEDVRHGLLRSAFAWLILFCLSLGALPAFGQTEKSNADQVFCPLQQKWVSRNQSLVASYKNPLDEICSSDQRKEMFFSELSRHLFAKYASAYQTEDKFFSYLGEGKQIFAKIWLPTNLPNQQITKLISTEKSGVGKFQADFTQKTTEVFSLAQFPRPPTRNLNPKSDYQFAQELKKISRRINPRSPPSFI